MTLSKTGDSSSTVRDRLSLDLSFLSGFTNTSAVAHLNSQGVSESSTPRNTEGSFSEESTFRSNGTSLPSLSTQSQSSSGVKSEPMPRTRVAIDDLPQPALRDVKCHARPSSRAGIFKSSSANTLRGSVKQPQDPRTQFQIRAKTAINRYRRGTRMPPLKVKATSSKQKPRWNIDTHVFRPYISNCQTRDKALKVTKKVGLHELKPRWNSERNIFYPPTRLKTISIADELRAIEQDRLHPKKTPRSEGFNHLTALSLT